MTNEEKKAYDNLIMLEYFTMEKEDKQAIETIKYIQEYYNYNNIELPTDLEIQIFPGASNTYTLYEDDDLIIELKNRITALENEIRTMKRKQMIKTIVELGAPFALLILLVIVFLSSGIMDNIRTIFDMAGIAL